MTHDELVERAGRTFGGRGWRVRLSELTGAHYSTVKRWAAGDLPVPVYVETILDLIDRLDEGARASFVARPRP